MSRSATSLAAPHARGHDGQPFRSILFGAQDAATGIDEQPEPECFTDLNLDQIVEAMTAGRDGYRLTGFFHTVLSDVDTINYRQEVFQDLEQGSVHDVIAAFAAAMHSMRGDLAKAEKAHYHYQTERWFLDAVERYCTAAVTLAADLSTAQLHSQGLQSLRGYLADYVESSAFARFRDEAREVRRGLDAIRYNLLIKTNHITVGRFDGEADFSSEVTKTFERFQQGTVGPRQAKVRPYEDMDHVEAGVLDLVAKLFSDVFAALDAFCQAHAGYLDRILGAFDREIQFYIAYLDYIGPMRAAGLELTYPRVSADSKEENAVDTFDLALARQLTRDDKSVVCNDIQLTDAERILVLSGPNNGGKTTLARTFGQLHYLAKLGCPVPGTAVRLFLCDEIYTHFEKEEDIATLAGKLQDELNRLRDDFDRATTRSVMIMNEMFSSTSLQDARFLSKEMLGRVSDLDALGVCVTFLDELASLNAKTVSMVSTVVPDDPATRTFKVIRKPADGRAYARALAEKYGLTYETLKRRVTR